MDTKKQVLNFYRSFNCNPVILYVGQGVSDTELKEHIAGLPWSCVLTSRRDPEFASLFATEAREVRDCSKKEDIPAKPINKQLLNVLRLYGIEGEEDEKKDLLAQMFAGRDSGPSAKQTLAAEMFRILNSLLDCASQLVVVGYDQTKDDELSLYDFCSTLLADRIPDGSVHIWGVDSADENNKPIVMLANEKKFELISVPLAEALVSAGETQDDILMPTYTDTGDDVFYCDKTPVGISQDDLVQYRHMATLLTEKTVNAVRPYGKTMYERWFFNFLNLSSTEGPQWYGYLSKFYVKRSFEDPLAVLVRKMLDGSIPLEKRGPVILEGPSGSSKSVTLAALAYRIFNEGLCPVIFIKKDSFLFYNESEEMNKLEELMRLIDEKTQKQMRILIVWDCSSYRSVEVNALRLTRQLQNKGFRFVLVCSAYGRPFESGQANEYFKTEEPSKLFSCNKDEAQIVKSRSCYYVHACRDMTKREIVDLWNRISDYSGLSPETIRYWKNRFEEQNETSIFQYFYRLIALLRPNLESGLSREEQKIWQYVEAQVREILDAPEEEKPLTAMELALQRAGLDISALHAAKKEENDAEMDNIDMEAFCLCIAMFSRFKLEVPYNIAFKSLTGMSNANMVYSVTHRKLFDIITKIPLVYYGESELDGDYAFRFRNAFEAQLFLERKDPTGEKQLKQILEIIRLYGEEYNQNRFEDERFKKNLIDFLRLIGPNSDYYKDNEHAHDGDHLYILNNLDKLVAEVEALDVPNKDGGFTQLVVTFMREFYGKLWDAKVTERNVSKWEACPDYFNKETYEMRIEQLSRARRLADECGEILKNKTDDLTLHWENKQRMAEEKNSLAVETALINATIERLEKEYRECCEESGQKPNEKYCMLHTEYQETFRQLERVIYYNPLNGYAYNALFGAFEQMYNKEGVSQEKKLQHLSEIMPLVELATNTDIVNRGERDDELSRHVQRIYDFSKGYAITIDRILARGEKESVDEAMEVYFKLYDALMEVNNPAAILFVCQKERVAAQISSEMTDVLSDEQLSVCEKVCAFMTSSDNYECVSSNANAMALLIETKWMCINKRSLTGSRDRQLTYMTEKDWREIQRLCRTYEETAGHIGYKPIIMLIYALSEIQVNADFRAASDILRKLSEGRFFNLSRTRTPYMICEPDGTGQTKNYTGRVNYIQDTRKGSFKIAGIPDRLIGGEYGVHFVCQNLGTKSMPPMNKRFENLELGLGYMGLTAYTEQGRKERGESV